MSFLQLHLPEVAESLADAEYAYCGDQQLLDWVLEITSDGASF